jgi:fructose-bisphosphate aldolase, class II
MFVTKPRLFLKYVFENRFAVPSFNCSNLEMVRAVVDAAVLEEAPVMVQTDFINFNYAGINELYSLVRTIAERANAPILLHQDHPGEDHNIFRTLRAGYYSVMYDGAHHPLAENIRETKRFVEIAHAVGANLESEIGLFGGEYQGGKPVYCGPAEAVQMEESGTDTLAVSVGSEHGSSSRLDLKLLSEIAEKTGIPLVMHGGSGIHPDDAQAATKLNVYKINIGAALISGFVAGLAEGAALPPDHEPKHQQILRHVSAKLRDIARGRISLFGASGHGRKLQIELETAVADMTERVRR